MSDPDPLGARSSERPWSESASARYGAALALVAAATILMFVLYGLSGLEPGNVPFVFYFGAVLVAALYGGRGPGLLVILLSALTVNYFFLGTPGSLALDFPGLLQTSVFVLVSLFISALADRSARAETAAQQSRESMETTLKSIGDAVIATDGEGRVRFMNPVAERLTGWTLAAAAGRPLAEVFRIVNERTREAVESPVERVLREGDIIGLANHTVLIARDGRELPIEDSGAPIRDARGQITGVVLVFHDVAERRESEQRLRESEERFRTLADTAPVMIWMSDRGGRFEYFNKPWLDFTARSLDEERGEGWVEGVHPEDRAGCLDLYGSSFEARRPFVREYRLRRHDGEYRWMLDHGVPRHSAGGEFLGYVGSCIDIHEHKEAERERSRLAHLVAHERERLRNLVSNVPGIVWEAWGEPDESSQRINFVSEHVEQMLGYTVEEWLRTPNFWLTIVHPEDRERAAAEARAIYVSGEGGASQFRWLRRDGHAVHVEAQSRVILGERGEPVGMRGVTMDISARKSAEEALTASRARLEGIVDSAMDAIISVGEDQRILLFNHAAEKMFRCTAAEALGRHLDRFIPERFRAEHHEHVESFGRTGVTSRAMAGARDVAGLRADGDEFPLEASISQVEAGGQRLYTVIMRDITERRAAEERLRFLAEASRVLGSSLDYETTLEGLARLAVAGIADYCVVDLVDDDGRARRVAAEHSDPARQPLVERLRDFPPGPQSGGPPPVLRTGRPEAVAEVTEEVLASIARDAEHAGLLRELELKSFLVVPLVARERTIGALTFCMTRAHRHYTDADVAYAQEIAARAALAIENSRLYGRAQEVNRAKDEFLATLSHELRTPLTPILGWTHMIRSGRLGPNETVQGVRVIEKNSQSLSRLINDLLDMSSVLSGKMRIERAPVDLTSAVREAAETVRPQADANAVALDVQAPGGASPVVSGDRTRLVQVFWNLLHNAVKFSPEGGRVRVRVRADERSARVEIEDEGAGIAPDFLPHVFERFRQADMGTTRQHGGLGLGLALVKSFVEAHGGSVAVESAGEGRGSRFTVSLPSVEYDGARRASGDLDAAALEPCPAEVCHVLVIEDAPDTLDMLKVVFASRGYTASACSTPEEALRVAESGRFDIIVSDIGLPRIDGYELIARLRRMPHLREVPALALTGYAAPRDAEAALAAGFDAHVAKPVDPSELAERMDLLMRRGETAEPEG